MGRPCVTQQMCARQTEKGWMTAKPAKCQWGSVSLTFLGHTVGRGMMSTPDHSGEAIRNHASPVTKKDVHSILGTRGNYRKFIPNYAHNSIELTNAMRKSTPSSCLLVYCYEWWILLSMSYPFPSVLPYYPHPQRHIYPTDRRIH